MAKPYPFAANQFKSLWRLGGLTPWQLVHNVFEDIKTNNIFARASELAFYFLFALFPLLLLLMALFGLFGSSSVELQHNLMSYFADLLPPSAFQLLRHIASEMAAHASGRKLTFWNCCSTLERFWWGTVHDFVSEPDLPRPRGSAWFKVRSLALGLTLVIAILFSRPY